MGARVRKADFVRTIEAVYDVQGSLRDWLTSVLESTRDWLDAGAGIWGCSWTMTASGAPRFDEFLNLGGPPVSLPELGEAMPPEIGRMAAQVLRVDFAGLNSEVDPPACREYFITPLRPFGITDLDLINGRDVAGRGICIGSYLFRTPRHRRDDAGALTRLARHLVAGSRLRERLGGRAPTDADAAAILTPMGRIEHATAATAKADTRAALREAVLAMARARGAERRTDPDRAVRRWRVLADARFSLIDRFESDGRRVVVACENAASTRAAPRLTEREHQVVALYRLGAHPKLIAYELGIADATVRVLLSRAAHRLGLASARAFRSTPEE